MYRSRSDYSSRTVWDSHHLMLTTGERVIKFIETRLRVPEGDLVGQPVKLEPFQKDFIIAIFDNVEITDTAILSIARKNAKTALIAFLVIAFLIGPVARQNSRIVSGALSREQAAQVYVLAKKCAQISGLMPDLIHDIPSSKVLIGKIMNVEYRAISAEAKTAHGLSPVVAIIDEPGQIKGPQSDFIDAITTAQGAYTDPLLIYIGTQAATDADFFSIQIDDALLNKPPKTVCHVYEAPKGCELSDESAWYAANPALGKFRSLPDMRKQAEKAARMPSFANTFRNLNLNQRVSTFSPFISFDAWKACKTSDRIPGGVDVYGGLDLSKRTDLTAFTIAAHVEGNVLCETYFWGPSVGVKEREERDRVPYRQWADEGYLLLTPGSTVDYNYVVADIMRILEDRNLVSLAFDPWRIDIFKKSCEDEGVQFPMVEYGQGYKSMSPAVETVEALFICGKMKHYDNPVQTMCASNATTRKDPAGNRKLDKEISTGRIDGVVSMTMAIGSMNMEVPDSPDDLTDYLADPIIL
jgi:phage terminase large subunit-like protein